MIKESDSSVKRKNFGFKDYLICRQEIWIVYQSFACSDPKSANFFSNFSFRTFNSVTFFKSNQIIFK